MKKMLALALAMLLALAVYLKKHPVTAWEGAGLGLLIGGALGNLFDRLVYGHVIDMLEPLFAKLFVFNVADAFVCIGAGMMMLWLILDTVRDYKKEKAAKACEDSCNEE